MISGLISNIQKFCLHDGPGIRTTVFFKGCPLHCAWCHNPENISPAPELVIFEGRCIRCGQCVEVCPRQNRSSDGSSAAAPAFEPRAADDCNLCGKCIDECSPGARALLGKRMTIEDVMTEIMADRIFYEESAGGVTFSGGEPLLQVDFLEAILQSCRTQGIHTAIDTCGFAPSEHLLRIAPWTGLFLYDLKFMDATRHREFTGVSNERILENLRQLASLHANIWLRIPLIPGINDAPEELEALAQLAAELAAIRQVNLLPYHKIGVHKFKRLGQAYPLPAVPAPSAEQMEAAARPFARRGLAVKVGG